MTLADQHYHELPESLDRQFREAFIASAVTEVLTRDLTRSGDGLTKLDLLNESEVEKVLHAESRCDWV
jgi:hypothetical protein